MTLVQGEKREIRYQQRAVQMVAANAIQDFWDALVELVTNSDDSYHHLFSNDHSSQHRGQIRVELDRRQRGGTLVVKDRAAGFTNLAEKIEKAGERTSLEGDRGFMARGLKDCAALGRIVVETIVDDCYFKAEITPKFELIIYENTGKSNKPAKATAQDRERLGVPRANGTMVTVYFNDNVKIPQKETLLRELPWHRALRDITAEDGSTSISVSVNGGKPETVRRLTPPSELVVSESFQVPGYPEMKAKFELHRAMDPLPDGIDPRFRRSGILVKGVRGIYDCSFTSNELERDPVAGRFFGRIDCPGIDRLAQEWDECREQGTTHPPANPVLIIDPNRRSGLVESHPFTKALFRHPREILKKQFKSEHDAEAQKTRTVATKETVDRLKRLAKEASKFMNEKLEDLDEGLGGDGESGNSKRGLRVVPPFTQVEVGEQKRFVIYASRKLGAVVGSVPRVHLSKTALRSLRLEEDTEGLAPYSNDEDILVSEFALVGVEVGKRAQVAVAVDGLPDAHSHVEVVPSDPVDLDVPGGLSFHRNTYTVKRGGRRTLKLLGRFPAESELPAIHWRTADEGVCKLRERTEFAVVPGTTYAEATITIEGTLLNGKTELIAESGGKRSSCSVAVVEKEETETVLSFELTERSLGENYRAIWDTNGTDPNRLLITTTHESISRYLGSRESGYPGQHEQPFRVLLAELISDNVCRRIVEAHARALPHEFDSDKIYSLHSRLMKEFTPIAHRIQLAGP